jgi:hypothetical protein
MRELGERASGQIQWQGEGQDFVWPSPDAGVGHGAHAEELSGVVKGARSQCLPREDYIIHPISASKPACIED